MAPFAGPDPEQIIDMLRDPQVVDRLPLAMGGPGGPSTMIGRLEGDWCLYRTRVDEKAYTELCEVREAAGQPLYPEMRMQFIVPGTVMLRCETREALLEEFATKTIVLDRNYRASLKPRESPRDTSSKTGWLRKLFGG